MLVFFSWLTMVGLVASFILAVWILNRGFQVLYVDFTESGIYDDASASANFAAMLSEAQESMIVYDDGDNTETSPYNTPQVVSAVQEKLRANPDFELQCLFNCDDDLLFRTELEGNPRVTIRIRRTGVPASEIHYKIIDDGAKAYLSRHRSDPSERKFQIVDCTNVSLRHRQRVANVVLGRYQDHFARAFAASNPAN